MLALRTALQNPTQNRVSDADVVKIIKEWGQLKTLELRSWYLLQIKGGVDAELIDVNLFLSISVNNVRDWDDLSLVGWGLRLGGSPNLYVQSELGPSHILVYAVTQARINKINTRVSDALCIMLLIAGATLGSPAFDLHGGHSKIKKEESIYDKGFVLEIEKTFSYNTSVQKKEKYRESPTVDSWLRSQAVQPLDNYKEVLKNLGNRVPALVGGCLDDPEIAYLIPGEIPTFEFLISCQANSLFVNYPLNNNHSHVHVRSGEVVGMVQSVEGVVLEAFTLFINSGVQCSYFIVNRICRRLADAIETGDFLAQDILLEMLILAIKIGTILDTDQFNIIQYSNGEIAAIVEGAYSQPMWSKTCNAPLNTPVTDPMKQLAFNLGLDPNDSRERMCNEFTRMSMADIETLKNNAISRQQNRISNTVSTISEFTPSLENRGCDNGQNRQIKPEEYNDTSLIFYKDDNNQVVCYTSDMFQDMVSSRKDPATKKALSAELIRQIESQIDVIQSIGLDPSKPLSISESVNKLSQKDIISPDETDMAVSSVEQILKSQNLKVLNINNVNTDELNKVLDSIRMKQELLPKLTPKHQVDTFYMAVYYALRLDPGKTKIFLDSYRVKNYPSNIPISRKSNVESPVVVSTKKSNILVATEVEEEEQITRPKSKSTNVVLIEESEVTPTPTTPLSVPTVSRPASMATPPPKPIIPVQPPPVTVIQQFPPQPPIQVSSSTAMYQQPRRTVIIPSSQLTPVQKEALYIQQEQQNVASNQAKLQQEQAKVAYDQQALNQEKQSLSYYQQQFLQQQAATVRQQQLQAQQQLQTQKSVINQQQATIAKQNQQVLAEEQLLRQQQLQAQQQLQNQQAIINQQAATVKQQQLQAQQQQQAISQKVTAQEQALQRQQMTIEQQNKLLQQQQQQLSQSKNQQLQAQQQQQRLYQQTTTEQQQIARQQSLIEQQNKALQAQQQQLNQSRTQQAILQQQLSQNQQALQQKNVSQTLEIRGPPQSVAPSQVYLPPQQSPQNTQMYIPPQTQSQRSLAISGLPQSTYYATLPQSSPPPPPPSSTQQQTPVYEEEVQPYIPTTPRGGSPASQEQEYI